MVRFLYKRNKLKAKIKILNSNNKTHKNKQPKAADSSVTYSIKPLKP